MNRATLYRLRRNGCRFSVATLPLVKSTAHTPQVDSTDGKGTYRRGMMELCRDLRVTHSHLWRYLAGERPSAALGRRIEALPPAKRTLIEEHRKTFTERKAS